MKQSGLEERDPIPLSTVKALETLARKLDRELDLPQEYTVLNLTDRLLLALPWLAGKLTYPEASQVVTWARILWSWDDSEEKWRKLEFANIVNIQDSEKLMGPVCLEIKREKRIKELSLDVKAYDRKLKDLRKKLREAERAELAAVGG